MRHRSSPRRFMRLQVEQLEERALLAPVVQYQVHVVPPGAPLSSPNLTSVTVGQYYDLSVSVQDLRPDGMGVREGYLDIGYDSARTQVVAPEVHYLNFGPYVKRGVCNCMEWSRATFSLEFGGQTTATITGYPGTHYFPGQIEGALSALKNVGAGNVKVWYVEDFFDLDSANPDNHFIRMQVEFIGKFLGHDVPNMTVATSEVVGMANPTLSIQHVGDLQDGIDPISFTAAFQSRDPNGYYGWFPGSVSAQSLPNQIHIVGARFYNPDQDARPGTVARELVRGRFQATGTGPITFTPDLANVWQEKKFRTRIMNEYDWNQPTLADIDPGAAVTLIVTPRIDPLVAADDSATVVENSRATTIEVLANDSAAPAGGTANVISVTQPGHGTVTFAATNLAYTPEPNFSGTDTFTYTARNISAGETSLTSTATVTVTVNAALVRYEIRILPTGAPLSAPDLKTVNVGESYDVAMTVQDVRADGRGVYAAFVDLGYDSSKTRVQVAETQYLTIDYDAEMTGTFTLDFGGEKTAPIEYSPEPVILAGRIQAAFDGLSSAGPGNVVVWGDGGAVSPYKFVPLSMIVAFRGKFLDQDVPNTSVHSVDLQGGTEPRVSIEHRGDLRGGVTPLIFDEAFRSQVDHYQDDVRAAAYPNRLQYVGGIYSLENSSDFVLPGSDAREVVRATFVATAAGILSFTPDAASDYYTIAINHDGTGESIPIARIDPGAPKSLTITKRPMWHNALLPLDVSGPDGEPDNQVAPNDALEIINYLNAFGSGAVPEDAAAGSPYYDTNGDDFIAPDDCLDIINYLNAFSSGSEGEALDSEPGMPAADSQPAMTSRESSLDEVVSLLSMDLASQPKRRR